MTSGTAKENNSGISRNSVYELGRVLEIGIPTFGIRRFGLYTARTTHIRSRNDTRSNEELAVTELGEVYIAEIVPLGNTGRVMIRLWLPDHQCVLDSGWETIL